MKVRGRSRTVGARSARSVRAGAVLVLAAGLALAPLPSDPPSATADDADRVASGWLPYWDLGASEQAVLDHAERFREAMPFWYEVALDGRISGHAGAGDPDVVSRLQAADVEVLPTITNPLGPHAFNALFSDDDVRSDHLDEIVQLVEDGGFDGIDINYEHVAVSTDEALSAQNRALFSGFVEDLCERLRDRDARCSVVVMARTDDAMQASYRPELAVGVYDYAAIGAAADVVRVMTYDQHYPHGEPGPIAGYGWVEAVLDYTLRHIPPDKVEMGFPTYGRDWPATGERAQALTTREATERLRTVAANRTFDPVEREARFTYRADGTDRTVWFGDHESLDHRLWLARRLGLRGVAFWTTGGADASVWSTLDHHAPRWDDVPASGFRDVSPGGTFDDDIAWLVDAGVTRGCNPPHADRFCPDDEVTRGQMAALLVRALGLPAGDGLGFADVPDDHTFADDIDRLASAGITDGCEADRFCPSEPITRRQMARMLTVALDLNDVGKLAFDDVGPDDPFAGDIDRLATAGITTGCAPQRFCPLQPVTRGQMAAFLHRGLG